MPTARTTGVFVALSTALALFVALVSPHARAATNEPPSVVLIVLDDVSWEEFALLPLSNLESFAPFARVYTRHYTCAVCSPSRLSLLSGVHPHRAFVGWALDLNSPNVVGLAATEKTLPERLAAHGYATGLFGKSHVSGLASGAPIESARVHGFEVWRAGVATNIVSPQSHHQWTRTDDGKSSATTTYSTNAVIDAATAWWAATSGPKFAMICPLAPHEPYDAPPAALLPPGYTVGASNRARYEAALIALDRKLADLLTVLDLSNTHIVLTSDNGTPRDVQPTSGLSPGYKLSPYEGGVRTPLAWWGPGVQPGVDATLVHFVDLPRTILDVVGVPTTGAFDDAIAFADTLQGAPAGPARRQYAYVAQFRPNGGLAAALTTDDWAVVREDGWKLVKDGSLIALFDLASDPWEQNALDPTAPAHATLVADLLAHRSAVLGPLWPY